MSADLSDDKPTCFMAMPVQTHPDQAEEYGDSAHWQHVMEELFIPAIEAAGYTPIKPTAKGTDLIHDRIIEHLEKADLVLCDQSQNNPNVFFELGVRTSLNMPVALVTDGKTRLPFDTSGLNTHTYDPKLFSWLKETQVEKLREHIIDSAETCGETNPLWQKFGLTLRAETPEINESPAEAKFDLLTNELLSLRNLISQRNPLSNEPNPPQMRLGEIANHLDDHAQQILDKSESAGRCDVIKDETLLTLRVHFFASTPPFAPIKLMTNLAERAGAKATITCSELLPAGFPRDNPPPWETVGT